MTRSIKTNYIFNLINTVSSFIFPVITFPYASRIMLAEGIGLVNFYQSIIQYISLFTCLGIPMYAIREIAKVRDNPQECSKTTLEILFLHLFLTFLGYLIVYILCLSVTEIQANITLFLIISLTLILTTIGCEWFYQGIEDFKYITIRGLIVKIAAVIVLFTMVKTQEDILWYGSYCVVGVLGGNIFNFIRLRKFVHFTHFRNLHPFKHLKPALHIFLLNLIISLYVNLNSVMLGFLKDSESVGFFTAATKLSQMILGIASALGTVMLPRLSHLVASNNMNEFNRLAQKAIKFMFAITLPLSIGCFFTAPYIIPIFCGETYHPAINTLQLISPIIFFIGLSGVLGIQILYPQGQENKVIVCTALGAIINLILNFILIPNWSHLGAAVATLFAEIVVTISMLFIGKNFIPIIWKDRSFLNYILGSIGLTIIILLTLPIKMGIWEHFIIITFSGVCIYLLILKAQKDELYTLFETYIKHIIHK